MQKKNASQKKLKKSKELEPNILRNYLQKRRKTK